MRLTLALKMLLTAFAHVEALPGLLAARLVFKPGAARYVSHLSRSSLRRPTHS